MALFLVVASESPKAETAVVYGEATAPDTWAAVRRDGVWVCWNAGSDPQAQCFVRVALELAEPAISDPLDLRVGFASPDVLVLRDENGSSWVVRPGRDLPQENEDATLAALASERPRVLDCSPTGFLPVHLGGRWRWIAAPCRARKRCPRPHLSPSGRRPLAGLRLSVGLETGWRRESAGLLSDVRARSSASHEAWGLATVRVGFDPGIFRRRRSETLALIKTARRSRLVPQVPPGPLAAREQLALENILCTGAP